MLEDTNQRLIDKIEDCKATKRTLIIRTKQLEEDLEAFSKKVAGDLFSLRGTQEKLEGFAVKLGKYKKALLSLRAKVDRGLANDEFLRDIVTDSEPRTPRDRRKSGQQSRSMLAKRGLHN